MTVSQTFLSLVILKVLRGTGKVFYRRFFNVGMNDFFYGQTEVMGFQEEDHPGKVPFSFYHIKGRCFNITDDVNLDHLGEVILSGFSTVQLYPSPLPILYSLEGSHKVHTTLNEQGIMFHLLKGTVL